MNALIRVIGWSNPANIVLNIAIVSLFINAVQLVKWLDKRKAAKGELTYPKV